jgi:Rod binding domain-containing protein
MSNLNIQTQSDTQGVAQTVFQPGVVSGSKTSSTPQPRLVKAAHEFEAAMMTELMGPLEPGHDSLGGGDDDSGSSSALDSFAGEALGKAISEHGGFGIANSIIRQLTAGSNHSGNSPVPAKRTQYTPK